MTATSLSRLNHFVCFSYMTSRHVNPSPPISAVSLFSSKVHPLQSTILYNQPSSPPLPHLHTSLLRRRNIPLLRLPPCVRQPRPFPQLHLPHHILLLFPNRRRIDPRPPQPLVPLRRHLNIRHVVGPVVLDDAAWEGGGRIWGGGGGLDGARELPVGVAGQVLADEEGAAPGEAQHFPAEPEVAEGHGEEGWE